MADGSSPPKPFLPPVSLQWVVKLARSIRWFLIEPFPSVKGTYARRQSRFLGGLFIVLIFFALFVASLSAAQAPTQGYGSVRLGLAGMAICFFFYLGIRTKYYLSIAAIFLFVSEGGIYFLAANANPAPNTDVLLYLIFPILLAGFFFPLGEMAIFILVGLAPFLVLSVAFPIFHWNAHESVFVWLATVSLVMLLLTRHRNLLERAISGETMAQETRFRRLLEQSFEAYCSVRNGAIRNANEKFFQMFGYPATEVSRLLVQELFLAEDLAPPRTLQPGTILELIAVRKDGSQFFAEIIIYADEEEAASGWLLAIRDISQRKTMEQVLRKEVEDRRHSETALRESQFDLRQALEEKRQLLDAITSIMIRVDPHGRVSYWNQPAELSTGLSSAEAMGNDFSTLPLEWDGAALRDAILRCNQTGKNLRLPEITLRLQDGRKHVLGLSAHTIPDPDEEHPGVIFFGSDITEQLFMQQQLEQRSKLESIGQLSAGVAHEINTPTQFIGNNLRFLRDQFSLIQEGLRTRAPDSPPRSLERRLDRLLREYPISVAQSLEGIDRISEIVSALRDFSHPGSAKRALVNINHGLESTIAVARNEWKYIADLEMHLDTGMPPVECHAGEVNQVFLNILINAVHAIHESLGPNAGRKGRITITTGHTDHWVEVRIADSGSGIPKAIQARVFDPFFTTKEVGRGTGQGLAISHNIIVQKHNGTIHFETEEGKGTTFIIRLPIQSETQATA
jgi:PAS domain S-box-containing protein